MSQPDKPKDQGPLLFQFTEQQKEVLAALIVQRENILLTWKFSDPAKDGERIRQHAALVAERDMLMELYNWDAMRIREMEEKARELLAQQQQQELINNHFGPIPSGQSVDNTQF